LACPTCTEDGEYYAGSPRAEVRHFGARSLWALHRLRRALAALGRADRTHHVSCLIRDLESIAEETNPKEDS
jgi:hypothetical protein